MSQPELPERPPPSPITTRQKYNIVTDTMAGPNVRLRDNLFQAVCVVGGLIGGIVAAVRLTTERPWGPILGGFGGVLAGLFGSGILLMIVRAIQHARGRHD